MCGFTRRITTSLSALFPLNLSCTLALQKVLSLVPLYWKMALPLASCFVRAAALTALQLGPVLEVKSWRENTSNHDNGKRIFVGALTPPPRSSLLLFPLKFVDSCFLKKFCTEILDVISGKDEFGGLYHKNIPYQNWNHFSHLS